MPAARCSPTTSARARKCAGSTSATSTALTFERGTGSSQSVKAGKFIWMDGALVPWDEAKVHVLTHTLHYGLGAFEGLRCYACDDGRSAIFRLREHMVRLWQS